MARKSSSSSGGGLIGGILVLAFLGMIASALPYILAIGAIALGIWLIVWIIKKISDSASRQPRISAAPRQAIATQNVTARSMPDSSTRTSVGAVSDSLVCKEVRRQILEVFEKRHNYVLHISECEKEFNKRNRFWNKNKPANIATRAQIAEDRMMAENRLNSSVFTFNEETTPAFEQLKRSFQELARTSTKTYDSSPDFNRLLTTFKNVGDINYIRFDVEPICFEYSGNLFYYTPHYIAHFKDNGSFVNVYRTSLLTASITQGSWQEQIPHTTYLHTRKDGQRDLRYSYNPVQTYYTTRTHTVSGMLGLGMMGLSLKYEVSFRVRDEVISAVRAYGATEVANSFDPIFHVLRLLDTCNPNDANVVAIRNII